MSSGANSTDVVYTDADVLVDAGGESVDAVLIRDGRIAAVGTESDVLAAGPGVPRQGLDGATVIPGLIDTHPHLLHFAAMRPRWWTSPRPSVPTRSDGSTRYGTCSTPG